MRFEDLVILVVAYKHTSVLLQLLTSDLKENMLESCKVSSLM